MTTPGQRPWDHDRYLLGNLEPYGNAQTIGSPSRPFQAGYFSEGVTVPAATNGKAGTVTVNGVTPVAVGNTSITTNSVVTFSLKTVGGTVGAIPTVKTITPGTGFTVAGTASDTSVYNYVVTEIG